MKSKFKIATWFAAIVAAMAMAGCATTPDEATPSRHHDCANCRNDVARSTWRPDGDDGYERHEGNVRHAQENDEHEDAGRAESDDGRANEINVARNDEKTHGDDAGM